MTAALVVIGVLYVVCSLAYIHRLHAQLRGYEHVWEQIESIADKNQDGTFTINVQHLEEVHADEAHRLSDVSGASLLDELDGPRSPNRAA